MSQFYEYTSGRWIFNEAQRFTERRRVFDINGLKLVIAKATARPVTTLQSLTKLAEGGYNRLLEATFDDGYQVIARLPFPMLAPVHHFVASEAATLDLLRMHHLPVPAVLDYSPTAANPAGTEYLLLEKIQGKPLGDSWFDLKRKTLAEIMEKVVLIEKEFFSIPLPASGSIYHRRDLLPGEVGVSLEDMDSKSADFVIGPTAQHAWFYRDRASLRDIDRGPWRSFQECFEAVAKRERKWCEVYGSPRLHDERCLRIMNHFQVVDPAQYLQILADYLTMAPSLKVSSTHPLSRPVLRHPDLTPNNILISDTDEIVGLIDWQFAVVLPLCLTAGIPNSFQNWGDPVSESMRPPEMKLPPDLDQLPLEEQNRTRAVHRKRLVHFFYAGNTMMQIPEHYEALAQQKARLRARLYNLAGAPWEGDSVSLRHFLATATQEWPLAMPCPGELSDGSEASCPLTYTTEYMQQSADDYQVQEERLQELQEMREYLDIDRQGWVPDDAHWMKSKEMAKTIKTGLIKLAETNEEKTDALDHFPLDDHEE